MRKLLLASALVFMGCSDASKKVEELADRACACKDKACADKVMDDFVEFVKANKDAKGDQEKAKAAAEKFMTCEMKLGADPGKLKEAL